MKTYNDKVEDDALWKSHLLTFLTLKKTSLFAFFLVMEVRDYLEI